MTSPPRRPRTGRRARSGGPASAPDLAAVEAQLTTQLRRGAAHDVRLWWLCCGNRRPPGFAAFAVLITARPSAVLDQLGAAVAGRALRPDVEVLVSAVQLDTIDEASLAAIVTLPRDTWYPVAPIDAPDAPGLPPGDAERILAALAADIARDEPGWPEEG
jgi:hypothetical protein